MYTNSHKDKHESKHGHVTVVKAADGHTPDRTTASDHTQAPGHTTAPPARLRDLSGLQDTVGNAVVVQMLRRAGHPWAQEEQPHLDDRDLGHGHRRAEPAAPVVQRSAVHDVLRSPGRPLDSATRSDMEARLGADFSDVRIHNGAAAKASAAEVGARAYTSGSHVVIGDGGTDSHTLAHELTHVIQQRQGPVSGTDNGSGLRVSDPSDRFEREAETTARRALSGQAPTRRDRSQGPAGVASQPGTAVQRSDVEMTDVEMTDAPSPAEAAPRPATKAKKSTQKSVREAFNSNLAYRKHPVDQKGKWKDQTEVRGSIPKKDSPDRQALEHLSTQLFFYLKSTIEKKSKEQEIQSMSIGGNIVVAANLDTSINSLHSTLSAKMENYIKSREASDQALQKEPATPSAGVDERTPLREMLTTSHNSHEGRASDVAEKFRAIEDGRRSIRPDSSESLLNEIARSKENPFTITDLQGVGAAITGNESKIIFLRGGSKIHAEQKLVLALHSTTKHHEDTVHIYGKKRPCTGCHATLSYARGHFAPKLQFNTRPGGKWNTSNSGFYALANATERDREYVNSWVSQYLAAHTTHLSKKLTKGTTRAKLTGYTTGSAKETAEAVNKEESGWASATDSESEELRDDEEMKL
ncbi:DUF4157 domain-containing protein [Streptomyces sp. NPDC056061]|uniref:eCIS core domain-containing protein n=1 Tax=Streptomyces sp. NPDC056061 TaxID=3345700 RepID=UPI0035DF2598